MNNLRNTRPYGTRAIKSESIDSRPQLYIAVATEGEKTEKQYFEGLRDHAIDIGIDTHIHLEPLEAIVHKSHPKRVIELLDEFCEKEDYQTNKDNFCLWLVVDRDPMSFKKEQLDEIIAKCQKKNYKLVLSNPNFELWLLMHVKDISSYDFSEILANRKTGSKSFLERELATNLPTKSYKKSDIKFYQYKNENRILKAIEQSKQYATTFPELYDQLGTQVGIMVEQLLQDDGSDISDA